MTTNQPLASLAPRLLRVKDLHLEFPLHMHLDSSWRDRFVGALTRSRESGNRRERHSVLKDLSFEVRRGERIGIVGVNGTGKSSLCRCIAGVYTPTSGSIARYGKVRALFETSMGINGELTGRENALVLGELLFPDEPNRKELVEEAMEFSELGKFLDAPFKVYSLGMQTRLCLSIVTAQPSDILILDEVFTGADIFFQEKMIPRSLQMIERSGAVLMVSHSPHLIAHVCNRVIVLHEGRILYDGGVDEALNRYVGLQPLTAQA